MRPLYRADAAFLMPRVADTALMDYRRWYRRHGYHRTHRQHWSVRLVGVHITTLGSKHSVLREDVTMASNCG